MNLKVNENSSKSFKLLSSNFRSIRSKAESFTQLIVSERPNFISVTESWLNATILSSEIFPPQYNTFCCDQSDGYSGVFLLVIRIKLYSAAPVACTVQLVDNKSLVVLTVYRPPNRDITYMHNLCKVIEDLYIKYEDSIIWITGNFKD